ncbi:MAG: PBECR2 nuclease fold domain-containing protein [Magnetococcus sp. DMHC-1]|nr:hypothetical protein [Magnetococcales bacterium]
MKKNSIRILPGQKSWQEYGRPNLAEVPDHFRIRQPAILIAGRSLDEALQILTNAVGISPTNLMRIVETPVEKVILQRKLLEHVAVKRTDAREQFGNFLLPTLTDPYEVWLTRYQDGYRTQYIGLFQGHRDMLAIVQVTQEKNLFWNLIRARSRYMDSRRVGTLIYTKEKVGG